MLRESVGWRVYLESGAIRMAFFGFSSGLPLLLVLGTLGFWLREAGVDLKTIGFMSWIGLIYGLKWSWAPLVDRLPIPILTHWLGSGGHGSLLRSSGDAWAFRHRFCRPSN